MHILYPETIMAQVLEGASWLCTALIAIGAIGNLCPQDKMVRFVQSLIVLTLLASIASSLLTARWDFALPKAQARETGADLTAFLNSQYEQATEEEAEGAVRGLLGAAGLSPKKIHVSITSSADSGIVLAKVSAAFSYPAEAERAKALLGNVLGDGVILEVTADGS